jgi:hypothetical protein
MSLQMNRLEGGAGTGLHLFERWWQWPLALWAEGWGAWAELMWPQPVPPPPHPHASEHDQLIVPEPIEAAGERSLFA